MIRMPLATALILPALWACTVQPPENAAKRQRDDVSGQQPDSRPDGQELFRRYCANCHPDGGNVSDPARSLHGSALKTRHITAPADIVRVIRTPSSRMISFDRTTLSDEDAYAIASHILKTY